MCYVCTTYLVRHGLTEGIVSPTSYLAVFPVSPTTEQTDGRRGTSNKQTCWTRCMLRGMCAWYGDRPIQGTLVLQKNLYMHCCDIYCILTVLYNYICMPACKLSQTRRTCTLFCLNNSHTRSTQLYIGQQWPEALSV